PDLDLLPPDDLGPVRAPDAVPLCVRAAGDPGAPVLLLVHGFGLDMTVWHPQWAALAGRFRCVLVDLRGHGRSGAAPDLSLRAMADDVGAALDAAGPGPVVVVGHSMGAMAVIALAGDRPELFGPRVVGVVLIGAAAGDLLRGAIGGLSALLRPASVPQAVRRLDRLRRHLLASRADVAALVARLTQFGPDPPRSAVEHVVALAARAPARVWSDGLSGLLATDLRPALEGVRAPALVVVGDHDRITPVRGAEALAAGLPEARLEVIPGAGHLPMLERPEAVNALLSAFADRALGGRDRKGGRAGR
ncbi:MAG TPA: alpha/beta hydrolase, partial [Actinomycetota bacterium]|nr:alpha/beta hydrolase [Actinomycetota bacterium]